MDSTTRAVVERFLDAFNRQDLAATMTLMGDDCLFENTFPAPDGTRHEGREEVREAFATFFRTSPCATFTTEEIFTAGEHCVVRWLYHWRDAAGDPGYVRGVDLFLVRRGKVLAKRAYVKG